MAKLPKLNQANSKAINSEPTAIAVVDDDSLKKIVSADKKNFQNTVGKNTKQITSSFNDVFSEYKVETVDIFNSMRDSLESLIKLISDNNQAIISFFKDKRLDEKKEEIDDIEKRRKKPPKKIEEEASSSFKEIIAKILGKVKKGGLAGLGMLENPGNILGTAKGAFFGTALGGIVANVMRSPLKAISGLFGKLPKLAGPALFAGNLFNAFEKDGTAPDKNNSPVSNFIGKMFGSGKDDTVVDKVMRYGGNTWAGAKVGGLGGPFGALLGGLSGLGLTAAGDRYGEKNVSGAFELLTEKFKGFMDVTGGPQVDRTSIDKRVKNLRDDIGMNQLEINEKFKALAELYNEKRKAEEAGDTNKVDEIQKKIEPLERDIKNSQYNSDLKNKTIQELTDQKNTGNDNKNERYGFGKVNGNLLGEFLSGVRTDQAKPADNSDIFKLMTPKKPVTPMVERKPEDFWLDMSRDYEREKDMPIIEEKRFPGKEADDLGVGEPKRKIEKNVINTTAIPVLAKEILDNLYVEAMKPKTRKLMNEAKKANEGETGAIAKMLSGMVNNIVNSSTVNNTVSNKTFVNRPSSTHNRNFSGYGRGE